MKHGASRRSGKTAEYQIWLAMRQRCSNPRKRQFADYGGRGVVVCPKWDDFAAFLEDMGPRPTPRHSIDRWPDKDGNYEPGNCRWATATEQASNTRRNVVVSVYGEQMNLKQAVDRYGGRYGTVLARIHSGKSAEEALGLVTRSEILKNNLVKSVMGG